jgi:hypothetical protein
VRILIDHEGRQVRLTEERLKHLLSHPEMAGMEQQIIETLKSPESVIQSRTDPAVRLFHRRQITAKFGDKWLCIVVKYLTDDAFVITSYLTDKEKFGTRLWPNPS